MNLSNGPARWLGTSLFLACLVVHSDGHGQASASTAPLSIEYGGVKYLHRWSKADQHEFTPNGQDDLARWQDMVTVNVHPSVRDGEQLAALANQVLGRYKAAGKVVSTDSVPRSDKGPAQHVVVAVLRGSNVFEAVFARFLLVDAQGVVLVYSHREYGPKAGTAVGEWLDKNGSGSVNTLMKWTGLPRLEQLKQLPESK